MAGSMLFRALFVDDEINILNALKRVVRPVRNIWAVDFASSGAEALRLFENQSYDLIVSDMRMPEMDGAQLLKLVRTFSPQSVRCILSGFSERETLLRTAMYAHQYLSKPTDPADVLLLMDRVVKLLPLLRNPEIRKMISTIEALPSLPDYHRRLINAIDSDEASLSDIAELISRDIGMSSNVLKLVNSAFFGPPGGVLQLTESVSWLGLELLKALVLTVGLFSAFKAPALLTAFHKGLMQHCNTTGLLAKRISEMENQDRTQRDMAFLCGLLHDLGKLVLAYLAPEKYSEVLSRVKEKKCALSTIEQNIFGVTHSEVGAYIAGLWGMNLSVVEVIAFHHHPAMLATQGFSTLMAVHVANVLAQETFSDGSGALPPEMDMGFLELHGKGDSVPLWRKLVATLEHED
jgi:putative nucleotidyltransferase with HDIG domain